ncbi:hypothetical protein [Pseudomonas putida]|uniref:hypothetical protein n=1 Tax=Pseudomonas putida TaxID=303 RepID=UPI00159566DC|nr:hypothetical protein [Pseudomonas putida]
MSVDHCTALHIIERGTQKEHASFYELKQTGRGFKLAQTATEIYTSGSGMTWWMGMAS